MFDLPEPFGPTIPVIVEVKLRQAFFAKDLKPESSRDFRYINSEVSPLYVILYRVWWKFASARLGLALASKKQPAR
jgi:hypothetical protein